MGINLEQSGGGGGGSNPSGILTFDTSITSAQIKAATGVSGTDVSLIAAPGSGKMIEVVRILQSYIFGTVAYATGTTNVGVFYRGTGVNVIGQLTAAQIKAAAASSAATVEGTATVTLTPITEGINTPIVWNQTVGGAQYTAGDGTIRIAILYRIISIP